MDLSDKTFGEEKNGKRPENMAYQHDWAFYFSFVDDLIGSFFLDLNLAQVAPLNNYPNLVWVSLQMKNPREDGLSSKEEFEQLIEIEDRLHEFISDKHASIHAGRLTTNNRRDFYYYFGDSTLYDKTISEAMLAFPSYSYDYGRREDKDWTVYFDFMYPDPKQIQAIQNQKVIDSLEAEGDLLIKERKVNHWISFASSKDRKYFLLKIKDQGFQVIAEEFISENVDFPYSLQIERRDKVDIESVNMYTLYLWETANEYQGSYDGWETYVEKG